MNDALTYGRIPADSKRIKQQAGPDGSRIMTAARFLASVWLPFIGAFAFVDSSSSKLRLYQDVLPERSEEIDLRNFARYLANPANGRNEEGNARYSPVLAEAQAEAEMEAEARLPRVLVPAVHKKHLHELELARQKQWSIIEALSGKTDLDDILRKRKLRTWPYRRQLPYDLPPPPPAPPHEPPAFSMKEILSKSKPFNAPYHISRYDDDNIGNVDDDNDEDDDQDVRQLRYQDQLASRYHSHKNEPREMEEDQQVGYGRSNPHTESIASTNPEFTFDFGSPDLHESNPFAVKPNDPRYYNDDLFSFSDEKLTGNMHVESGTTPVSGLSKMVRNDDVNTSTTSPETEEGGGEHRPLVVPINQSLNNDIYFIAIVAGCSAAAMFALVLISLTWCRLQRGAKAAADIEYPAYGVTGPNKDVSPSGDQRLAQSAQMYHFQHQKQQIISMENRTAATRDPGSVSEAESEEENEEGDYTVYECPGLAPTGEMEVKNPLFNDDPTLATPARTDKEEDDT